MVSSSGLDWIDVFTALGTSIVILAVAVGGFYAYNAVMGTLWENSRTLKDQGVEKNEQGQWVIKKPVKLDQESYQDKTQRGFMKALGAASVSNTPSILGRKNKDKKGAKAE